MPAPWIACNTFAMPAASAPTPGHRQAGCVAFSA
jgi:hypothetical protein